MKIRPKLYEWETQRRILGLNEGLSCFFAAETGLKALTKD